MIRLGVLFSLTMLALAGQAAAQTHDRLSLFVADARLTFPNYKQAESVATDAWGRQAGASEPRTSEWYSARTSIHFERESSRWGWARK